VFADEAGNLDFRRAAGATRYFILTTVTVDDCSPGDSLLTLRRELAWEGHDQPGPFHATEDRQHIRDRVYAALAQHEFRVDATIVEKSKARPHLVNDLNRFHKTAWYLHMRRVAPAIATDADELLVVASALGTRRQRGQFVAALNDVVSQAAPTAVHRAAFWPAGTDPCLEVADYCCWALQRKWERGDERSYDLIRDRVAIEHDVFRVSGTHYY
jgi:hypothetical protein